MSNLTALVLTCAGHGWRMFVLTYFMLLYPSVVIPTHRCAFVENALHLIFPPINTFTHFVSSNVNDRMISSFFSFSFLSICFVFVLLVWSLPTPNNTNQCGRCGLVVSASGSGAEGPGFESWPGHGAISLAKKFTTNILLVCLVSVTVTRCVVEESYLPMSTWATSVVKSPR